MKDIMGLMSKAKEMQEKMQAMQEELANLEVEGSSGGGMVKVVLNGKGMMTSLSIDPSLIKEDEGDIVEDLVMAAHNDAKAKVEDETARKTQELTAGLPIPPGMKLPFG
ncbi:MAG: YbaB/EbfC family nucleoid-associated protein [Pseudomonadota bacterium]